LAPTRHYSGATGRARRYFGAAVGAGGSVGRRSRRRRFIGRVRHYFGAAVRVRCLGGWLPCRRRRAGLAGRHFGAAVGARRVPGRQTARRSSRSGGATFPPLSGATSGNATVVVYCLNMFGDAQRDLLAPRLRVGAR